VSVDVEEAYGGVVWAKVVCSQHSTRHRLTRRASASQDAGPPFPTPTGKATSLERYCLFQADRYCSPSKHLSHINVFTLLFYLCLPPIFLLCALPPMPQTHTHVTTPSPWISVHYHISHIRAHTSSTTHGHITSRRVGPETSAEKRVWAERGAVGVYVCLCVRVSGQVCVCGYE